MYLKNPQPYRETQTFHKETPPLDVNTVLEIPSIKERKIFMISNSTTIRRPRSQVAGSMITTLLFGNAVAQPDAYLEVTSRRTFFHMDNGFSGLFRQPLSVIGL